MINAVMILRQKGVRPAVLRFAIVRMLCYYEPHLWVEAVPEKAYSAFYRNEVWQ